MDTLGCLFFFFNDTATTEIYTLSLHDALPISEGEILFRGQNLYAPNVDPVEVRRRIGMVFQKPNPFPKSIYENIDRKSTRLNSSHANISYAVFCLKKKKQLVSINRIC